MKFCDNCENMLYLKIEEGVDNPEGGGVEVGGVEDGGVDGVDGVGVDGVGSGGSGGSDTSTNKCKLTYKCIKCNESYPSTEADSCVFNVNFNLDNIKKNSFINEFIYNDITLPKAEGIKCPNKGCPDSKPEIVYIQYDKEKMKFIYVCLSCHREGITPHIW